MTAVADAARDLRYGRRGGAWAEDWSDDDEARYQAALAATRETPADDAEQPSLFEEPDR